ncbi:MAG TPA: C45 family peptidase [Urbifossiella sp.]|nr:C45 family peptidase [Urbifossiella sp.]
MRHTTAEGYSYESVSVVDGRPPFPEMLLARSQLLLNATLSLFPSGSQKAGLAFRVAEKYPIHGVRAEAAADAIGVSPVDLLVANLCYDILLGTTAMGCSTLALAGPDGPTLARNMDWFPAEKIAKASCLVREDFGVNAGFIGLLGAVTGLSKRGFGISVNAVFGNPDPDGYPMLLFLRHVLDSATDFNDALTIVEREPLMSSGIITLVGTANDERAIVERTPREAFVRRAKGQEPLIATNHFLKLARPEACSRYEFLNAQKEIRSPLEVLTSRTVLQEITAQHIVIHPSKQSIEMFVPSHLLPEGVREDVSAADLRRFLG